MVTGAAVRIGAAIATRLHAAGYRVLLHYRSSQDAVLDLARVLNHGRPDSAHVLQADLCQASQVESLAAEAMASYSRLDALINNASAFYPTPLGTATQAQWDELMDSNLRAAYFLSQALGPELKRRRGNIINIVDIHADRPPIDHGIYSMAKAGLKAMTRSLAREFAPKVRVNGVAPGAILWPAALADESDPEVLERRRQILNAIPLGVQGSPEDIAGTAHFLIAEASYVTGQVLRVDGGRHLV